ncbi:M48 family metallopeptidase [Sutterella sp.]|uniref:M48 family metallopeptidase n=1 Tax=Sutterella sp. TaxID=1981025 RepID=UPI0026E0DE13|nr:SprT family zinc-dependent metalloprotease [Sutterella sp.]MDO5531024.1 SprT family zinc-dependent metalloprotease [Sutterella sp.]
MNSRNLDPQSVEIRGVRIPYVIRENGRRRRLSLYAVGGALEARVPPGTTRREIEAFILRSADWVLAQIRPGEEQRPRLTADRLSDGVEIPWRGGRAVLRLGMKTCVKMPMGDGKLELWLKSPADAPKEKIRDELVGMLKEEADRVFNACFTRLIGDASHLPQRLPFRISITSARGRWGSCSAKGSIRLTWRMMALTDGEIEYVIAHELAHLVEFNHSARFWAEVGRICPGWEEAEKQMRARKPDELLHDL